MMSTNELKVRVSLVIESFEREDRVPINRALYHCDGSLTSFAEELSAQVWDFPELDVDAVLDRVAYDIA